MSTKQSEADECAAVAGIKTAVPSSGSLLVPPTARRLAQLPGRTPPPAPGQAVANRRVGVGGEITTAQEDDIWVVRSSSSHQWLVSKSVCKSVSKSVSKSGPKVPKVIVKCPRPSCPLMSKCHCRFEYFLMSKCSCIAAKCQQTW